MARGPQTFHVSCPQCKADIAANETLVGQVITCPDCLEEFVVKVPASKPKPATRASSSDRQTEQPTPSKPSQLGNSKPSPSASDSSPLPIDLFSTDEDEGASPVAPDDFGNWEDDRRQLKAVLNPAAGAGGGTEEPYEFTIACPLCGTRQEAVSEQVGKAIRCPDCHSNYKVREPGRRNRRPRRGSSSPDDEIRLRDLDPGLPARPDPHNASSPPTDHLQTVRPKQATILTPEDASRDTLERARKELEEQDRSRQSLPSSPLTTGIFRCFHHPGIGLRMFFIAMAWWIELGAIQMAMGLTHSGALQQFASVILRPLALVLGILLLANFASTLINVLQDTASGHDAIESLPSANPIEWLSEGWPVLISSCLVLLLPGIALQGVYFTTGSSTSALLFGLLPAGFLMATIFPVMLLSFLENSTPFSAQVFRGLQLAAKSWVAFTFQALILAGVAVGWCALRWSSTSAIINFLACVGFVATAIIYFRLLGRLTWVFQDAMAKAED